LHANRLLPALSPHAFPMSFVLSSIYIMPQVCNFFNARLRN
jgi:hypothetical protein